MKKTLSSNYGFTLVEILVSLVIISILVSAFSIAFINSNKSISISKSKSQAFFSAQKDLINYLGNPDYTANDSNVTLSQSNLISKTISFGSKEIVVELKEVEAKVVYKSFKNNENSFSIKSYRITD